MSERVQLRPRGPEKAAESGEGPQLAAEGGVASADRVDGWRRCGRGGNRAASGQEHAERATMAAALCVGRGEGLLKEATRPPGRAAADGGDDLKRVVDLTLH